MRRVAVIGSVLLLGLSAVASAQPSVKAKAAKPAAQAGVARASEAAGEQQPPAKGRPPTKIREGAYLRKDIALNHRPDLRSAYEKQRDLEVATHYKRLAELDWIEQLAAKRNDNRLLERVETVRRKETKRFRSAMTSLWEQARARALVGAP